MTHSSENSDHQVARPSSFSCELAGWNVTRLNLLELAGLRKQPETRLPTHITAQFLKNSDDQTIATLVALYSAVESRGSEASHYRNWGVVSASRFIGRGSFAATLNKYGKDGPWGVSVQVIPHNMLHSVSSTISIALPCVGPCVGAGGGADGEVDALMIAANLLSSGLLPGVWITWSMWEPELAVEVSGKPVSDSSCLAVAVALVPLTTQVPQASLQIKLRDSRPELTTSPPILNPTSSTLTNILQHIVNSKPQSYRAVCPLRGGMEVSIDWRPAPEVPDARNIESTLP